MTPIEEAAREWLKENMTLDLRDDGEPYGADVKDLAAFVRAQRLIGARGMRDRAAFVIPDLPQFAFLADAVRALPDEQEPCDGTDAGLGCDCGGPHGGER